AEEAPRMARHAQQAHGPQHEPCADVEPEQASRHQLQAMHLRCDGDDAGGHHHCEVGRRHVGQAAVRRRGCDRCAAHAGRSCSAIERVLSVATSPVCSVVLRSISISRHSSCANGLWRTPLGTTNISPWPSSTVRPSISILSLPSITKKNSSSCSWLCQANVPCTLATLT